jgi:GDP-4-dehydro-6-deoxy-D-mannose reductase
VRVLVTGASGFVGRHLCRHLRDAGDEPVPIGWPAAAESGTVDVTDAAAVRSAIEAARPEGVVHLAGVSSVAASHRDPSGTFAVNVLGAVHVLAAVQQVAPKARVLLIGSSEMYGAVAPGTRATEDSTLAPISPYASSKVAAEVAGLQFFRGGGTAVIAVRPFNHVGRGQRRDFVVPSLAGQIAAIRTGAAPPILRVGNLEPVRDFSHVADVVAAYRILLHRGAPGQSYNVCSGEGRSIRSVLDRLIALARVDVRVEVDPSRLRPVELPYLVGDPGKIRGLGWIPSHTLDEALLEALASAGESEA